MMFRSPISFGILFSFFQFCAINTQVVLDLMEKELEGLCRGLCARLTADHDALDVADMQ
jgi:hypothetical protein